MASEFLIPHPNIPTADIGQPKLKEVTVKNNENFLALDSLLRQFGLSLSSLDDKIGGMAHDHPYAPEDHAHQMADVEGLSEALDLKAPLVHTHDQYLTGVPAHKHVMSEVDGLLAELAGKAAASHVHNMGEVDGLQSSLANKADESYVRQVEDKVTRTLGDYTDDNKNVVTEGLSPTIANFEDWNAGGEGGLALRLYALVNDSYTPGTHMFEPVDLEFASNGMLMSAVKPAGDNAVFIGA